MVSLGSSQEDTGTKNPAVARYGASRIGKFLRHATVAATLVFSFFAPWGVRAGELVLFETAGCAWCEAWQKEVGSIYHLTEEARVLKLRRVEISAKIPRDLRRIRGVQFTPTFVVVHDGRELGRIEGFSSQDQFWGLLQEIIDSNRTLLSPEKNGDRAAGGN